MSDLNVVRTCYLCARQFQRRMTDGPFGTDLLIPQDPEVCWRCRGETGAAPAPKLSGRKAVVSVDGEKIAEFIDIDYGDAFDLEETACATCMAVPCTCPKNQGSAATADLGADFAYHITWTDEMFRAFQVAEADLYDSSARQLDYAGLHPQCRCTFARVVYGLNA